jgi:ring-1,2-phenylacetyl-CoA epoxidase subunit PaaE
VQAERSAALSEQGMDHFFPLRVASLAAETRDAKVITLDVPDAWARAFRFLPGQHLVVRVLLDGNEVRRAYSICSACHEPLRITVKRVTDGRLSGWLNDRLQPDDRLYCMPPRGRFGGALMPALARRHVAFAAGSGITPVFSIIKTVLALEPRSDFTLFYGNRTSSAIIFREALQELKDRYPNRFSLQFLLSREHRDVSLLHGRMDRSKCDALLNTWLDPSGVDVFYLCAPAGVMHAAYESLLGHGVDPVKIRREHYAGGGQASVVDVAAGTAQTCRITVIQDGLARQFTSIKQGQTLLDAALEQGLEMPHACKAGVCASCRCKLLSGEVVRDNSFALEEAEAAQGFILACQSVPVSAEITVDCDS